MSFDYEQYYDWKLECDHGEWTRSYNQSLDPDRRIDFQSPPQHFGRPLRISIIPKKEHLLFISTDIPEGATPVVHFAHRCPKGSPVEIVYCRIGYNLNGHRVMKRVDLDTGTRVREEDESGRVQMAGRDR